MRIVIDGEACTGHGRCYGLAPDLFDCDDEGFAVVEVEDVGRGSAEAAEARAAVDNCPEAAISLLDD